uniref:Uncharacterized protein n=1 Tax=Candidatus Kentrum sp. TC TaxID=2126339 RepID=A0A450YJ80_9GAMM|nr:MAG: hypothetical protein BECKTC1821E_GA0114239_101219 [Candidatus Kentron sp. TC]
MSSDINDVVSKIDEYLRESIDGRELSNFIRNHPRYIRRDQLFEKLDYIDCHSPVLDDQRKRNEGWFLLRKMIANERKEDKIRDILDRFIDLG